MTKYDKAIVDGMRVNINHSDVGDGSYENERLLLRLLDEAQAEIERLNSEADYLRDKIIKLGERSHD